MLLFLVSGLVTVLAEPGYIKRFDIIYGKTVNLFSKPEGQEVLDAGKDPSQDLVMDKKKSVSAFYFKALKKDVGLPVLIIFVVAIVYGLFQKKQLDALLLSFLFIYFFIICGTTIFWHYARYLLPVLPVVFLVVARAITILGDSVKGRIGNRQAYLVCGLLSVLVMTPVYANTIEVTKQFALPNTRILSKQWINKHVPAGARIMMEGAPEHRTQFMVPILDSAENVAQMVRQLEKNNPAKARYWQKRAKYLDHLDFPRYDIVFVRNSKHWPKLTDLKQRHVEYLVVNVSTLSMGTSEDMGYLTSRIDFYQELANAKGVERLRAFQADSQSSGPTIEIYKISG